MTLAFIAGIQSSAKAAPSFTLSASPRQFDNSLIGIVRFTGTFSVLTGYSGYATSVEGRGAGLNGGSSLWTEWTCPKPPLNSIQTGGFCANDSSGQSLLVEMDVSAFGTGNSEIRICRTRYAPYEQECGVLSFYARSGPYVYEYDDSSLTGNRLYFGTFYACISFSSPWYLTTRTQKRVSSIELFLGGTRWANKSAPSNYAYPCIYIDAYTSSNTAAGTYAITARGWPSFGGQTDASFGNLVVPATAHL